MGGRTVFLPELEACGVVVSRITFLCGGGRGGARLWALLDYLAGWVANKKIKRVPFWLITFGHHCNKIYRGGYG